MASRRFEKIDAHVTWIHNEILGAEPTRILDLGLRTRPLHQPAGAPWARVRRHRLLACCPSHYAKEQASNHHLNCTYIHDDMRAADYGSEFGLVMLLFGEFNVFSTLDARAIVRKASQALAGDGTLLMEPQYLRRGAGHRPERTLVVFEQERSLLR